MKFKKLLQYTNQNTFVRIMFENGKSKTIWIPDLTMDLLDRKVEDYYHDDKYLCVSFKDKVYRRDLLEDLVEQGINNQCRVYILNDIIIPNNGLITFKFYDEELVLRNNDGSLMLMRIPIKDIKIFEPRYFPENVDNE